MGCAKIPNWEEEEGGVWEGEVSVSQSARTDLIVGKMYKVSWMGAVPGSIKL